MRFLCSLAEEYETLKLKGSPAVENGKRGGKSVEFGGALQTISDDH